MPDPTTEAAVLQVLARVRAAVATLLTHRQTALADIASVKQVFAEWTTAANAGISAFDAQAKAWTNTFRTQVDAATIALQPQIAQLHTAASAVRDHLQAADQDLAIAEETLERLSQAHLGWVDRRQEIVQQLQDAVEQAVSGIQEKQASMIEGFEDFETQRDTRQASVETLLDAWPGVVDEHLYEPLEELRNRIKEKLEDIASTIAEEAIPDEITATAEQAINDIKRFVDEQAKTLGDALEGFVRRILENTRSGSESRKALQSALDQLRLVIDPLLAQLDRVRGLASQVGIPI